MNRYGQRVDFATGSTDRDQAITEAWTRYREALSGLTGRAYENAETQAWDELQQDLTDIERRSLLTPL